MARIKGISIILYKKTKTGEDDFRKPIYQETPVTVDNVLIEPTSSQAVIDEMNLSGRKAVYTLAIPKGDKNDWENVKVKFFGKTFKTIGAPLEGIEDLIPLKWNKKVMVENYEQV